MRTLRIRIIMRWPVLLFGIKRSSTVRVTALVNGRIAKANVVGRLRIPADGEVVCVLASIFRVRELTV